MTIYSMELPPNDKNIKALKKRCASKDVNMRKVRGKDLWTLSDKQNNCVLKKDITLIEVQEFIADYDF